MSSFQIIVGSMLGASEYVAEACQEQLEQLDHQVELHFSPKLDEIKSKNQTWLICTSTHGAGEYPENLQPFVDQLTASDIDLSTTQFMVIGLGDSSYDTFCYAAKNIISILKSKGCIEIIPLKTFDMQEEEDPEEGSQHWINQHKDQL